jgi:formyltetrahydrofolate-dependent phosphoribosylglycinamide formyltransferase
MFKKLKQHWKVNDISLLLIIATFALGGSLCGYAGRKILSVTGIDSGVLWAVLYIILITLLWPLSVILVSIPLGQFGFFKNYIKKIFNRFRGASPSNTIKNKEEVVNKVISGKNYSNQINIAIFASGTGSNALQIISRFSQSDTTKVALIVCNKPGAGVLQIAATNNIPSLKIEKERFFNADAYLPELQKHNIDFIVLAGFLWKIPGLLIKAYPKKIINIHPALLPKYGGKGMYGHFVHEAVIANKEKQSGITIHYVDELYDHGAVIFQATCAVDENETPESLAQKIHMLEHKHYALVIADLLKK